MIPNHLCYGFLNVLPTGILDQGEPKRLEFFFLGAGGIPVPMEVSQLMEVSPESPRVPWPPQETVVAFQYVLRRPRGTVPSTSLGVRVAFTTDVPGCVVTRIHEGGLAAVQNSRLQDYAAIGLGERILSPGDKILLINGAYLHADMKRFLETAAVLHMLVQRLRRVAPAVCTSREESTEPSVQPPTATLLPRAHIPPPPRTSILGPGQWPRSAQGICALFEIATNAEIDLDHAYMTHEVSDRDGPRVWFALEIRRLRFLDRPLHAVAHVTLLTGRRSAVDRAQRISQALQDELRHWRRNSPNGLSCTVRQPSMACRSSAQDYAWLGILPGRGLHERLHQAVALAQVAHAGPRSDLVPYRRAFHISLQTDDRRRGS